MTTATKIEWTDATWNPVAGCDRVSPGCDNCYAETIANRFAGTKAFPEGFKVTLHPERLDQPLKWRKPRRVFVNSMSDLFHPDIPDEYIGRIFHVMAAAPQHTFQVLTKRPQRMAALLNSTDWGLADCEYEWPLPNVWLGVSVENQRYADLRIPHLLRTPAAVRFLSCEPLLGPVDIGMGIGVPRPAAPVIDWVIVGGESGPGARPMSPWWARQLRDQCTAAGVPFFFKQHGEYAPAVDVDPDVIERKTEVLVDQEYVVRVGKKKAGRLLDGRTWDEYPS